MGDKIGYARISTADQNPRMQLDALEDAGCLKVYKDTATGTKAARPQWIRCLDDLRTGDTLVIWKIDRLGRNLRDLIDIITTLECRGVGVQSLTNGIVDTSPPPTANSSLNPPGFAGDSVSWEGWGHVEKIWELPEGAAGPCCSDGGGGSVGACFGVGGH